MDKPCESCGVPPPIIKTGIFAGSRGMHAYCVHCSKDLCDACLETKRCRESKDNRHQRETEET